MISVISEECDGEPEEGFGGADEVVEVVADGVFDVGEPVVAFELSAEGGEDDGAVVDQQLLVCLSVHFFPFV